MADREERKMEPFHHKLASLYWRFAAGVPADQVIQSMFLKMGPMDRKHFGESMKQHAIWANKLILLEEKERAAEIVGDDKWLHELGLQKDRLLLNITGGS